MLVNLHLPLMLLLLAPFCAAFRSPENLPKKIKLPTIKIQDPNGMVSVEEARKRAIVLAYLTYDMTRHIFVKFSTSKMLEDPFTFQNIYDCHEMFDLEIEEDAEGIDVKHNLVKQSVQRHQGVILTDKDAAALTANTKFKSVEVNEKFLNISVNDGQDELALEREISNF